MKICFVRVAIIALVATFFVTARAYSSEQKVVAKVGDEEITRFEFIEALKSYKPPSVYHDVSPEKMRQFERDALNQLIEIELLHKEAQHRGITISDSVINDVVEENIQRLGSKEMMTRELKRKRISLDEFKEHIKKNQMVMTLLNTMKRDAEYKDDELRRYYEENKSKFERPESRRLYHIVVKVDPGAVKTEWEKRRLDAEEILKKLKSGEDFGEIAYNYSEDDYKVKRGDYGFVHKGQLVEEVQDAVFSLREGELSGVIQSIYGYHIVRGGERRPQAIMSYNEVKEKTRRELNKKRFEEDRKALLERLREQYPVEIYIKTDD